MEQKSTKPTIHIRKLLFKLIKQLLTMENCYFCFNHYQRVDNLPEKILVIQIELSKKKCMIVRENNKLIRHSNDCYIFDQG